MASRLYLYRFTSPEGFFCEGGPAHRFPQMMKLGAEDSGALGLDVGLGADASETLTAGCTTGTATEILGIGGALDTSMGLGAAMSLGTRGVLGAKDRGAGAGTAAKTGRGVGRTAALRGAAGANVADDPVDANRAAEDRDAWTASMSSSTG